MPRKTRKQKQRAAKRKATQIAFQAQNQEPVKGEFKFEPGELSQARRAKKSVKKGDKSTFLYEPSLVVRDLSKTLLLALGVFSLEIVIYLAWFK